MAKCPKPGVYASDQSFVSAPAGTPASRRGTLDILLVEADPEQCRIVADCLDAPGREHIQIEFVHTVKDARAAVRRQKYNCVLVCHELPDGRGIDFLEEVGEELLTTPVIGLSASGDTARSLRVRMSTPP